MQLHTRGICVWMNACMYIVCYKREESERQKESETKNGTYKVSLAISKTMMHHDDDDDGDVDDKTE